MIYIYEFIYSFPYTDLRHVWLLHREGMWGEKLALGEEESLLRIEPQTLKSR